MQLSVADILERLRPEGVVPPGADAAARAALAAELQEEMPWHVRSAVTGGAWLATLFLITAVFAIANLRNSFARVPLGVVFIGAGIWLRRTARGEFLRQAAVAASLAGQALVIAGVGDEYDSEAIAGFTGVGLTIGLVYVMPDRVHRFLSTLVGVACAAAVAVDSNLPSALDLTTVAVVALTAFLWRTSLRERTARDAEMLEPVRYALVIGLFGLLVFATMASIAATEWVAGPRDIGPGRFTTSAITVALLALVLQIIDEHGGSRSSAQSVAALAGVAALGASTLSSPGLIAGVAVLVLAFDRRDRQLLGLAIVFLLVFGSAYYYSLHLTLLEKSGVLAGSGLLLLGVRQRIAPDEEAAAP